MNLPQNHKELDRMERQCQFCFPETERRVSTTESSPCPQFSYSCYEPRLWFNKSYPAQNMTYKMQVMPNTLKFSFGPNACNGLSLLACKTCLQNCCNKEQNYFLKTKVKVLEPGSQIIWIWPEKNSSQKDPFKKKKNYRTENVHWEKSI